MSQAYKTNVSPEEAVGSKRAATMFKMSANENPFGPSPKAMQALQETVPTLGLYPPSTDANLKEKLASVHQSDLNAEHFVTANSGCDVLRLVSLAYLDASSSIVISKPAFPVYERTAQQMGAEVIDAALDAESFAFRPEVIKAAITPSTKVVYLCNPNNPTGTTFGQELFDELLDAIPDDVLVVYDEVYFHFVTGMDLPDAKAAVKAGKNLLIVHSFSKSYGMAGLRVGYGIARPDIIEKLESKKNSFHIGALGLNAAEAALSDLEHVQKTVANNDKGRDLISSSLSALGLRVWPSQANFVLFEIPEGFTPDGLTQALQDHNVMVRPAFGLTNHLRVSVALPEANEAFVNAMKSIVNS